MVEVIAIMNDESTASKESPTRKGSGTEDGLTEGGGSAAAAVATSNDLAKSPRKSDHSPKAKKKSKKKTSKKKKAKRGKRGELKMVRKDW